MKLNFWQWLGIILLVAGAIFLAIEKKSKQDKPPLPVPTTPPATQPA